MPLGDLQRIGPGSVIIARKSQPIVKVGNDMLGRVIDGMGEPLDGKGPLMLDSRDAAATATPITP
ncbi:MAG: hypothetical protein MZU91_02955 [Desulfosudis oleivorans]|nr:hypothetical protein [Desulfosudis oleivorans]